ncbi:hypothetical protein BRADI_3g18769v3 [Brachypodium distachyon]|uniref:Uncharacterized protein n=1 Tax=Brachypodium distachyon TaxID=15368 RepID=A0A2K2CY42_BRADI|nr:hypothetical protein BRADI_3g18769v3 [Brachypodium distachyon]
MNFLHPMSDGCSSNKYTVRGGGDLLRQLYGGEQRREKLVGEEINNIPDDFSLADAEELFAAMDGCVLELKVLDCGVPLPFTVGFKGYFVFWNLEIFCSIWTHVGFGLLFCILEFRNILSACYFQLSRSVVLFLLCLCISFLSKKILAIF